MKRFFYAVLVFLLLLPLCAFGGELITNGGFEDLDSSGNPKGWQSNAYRTQVGCSQICCTDEKAHSGTYSALIDNMTNNDARYVFTAEVEPSSMYRMSAWVLVEEPITGGNGANLAVEDIISVSDGIFSPTEGWQLLEWYGLTGSEQTSVSLGIRIGGYGRESLGRAYFDDVSLTKVDTLPKGISASLWYEEDSFVVSDSPEDDESSSNAQLARNLIWIGLGAAAFLLLFWGIRRGSFLQPRQRKLLFTCLMLALLVLRILLALHCEGYQVDTGCFQSWSTRIATIGPAEFYQADYFCDYPPGAVLLLYPIGLLLNQFGTASAIAPLLLKLLPILADTAGALLLWYWGQKKHRPQAGFLAGALYMACPAVLVTGSAWGQIDSVMALLLLITAFTASEKKWQLAIPVYVTAVLVKMQSLLVGPVGLAWLVICLNKNVPERKKLLRQVLIGILISLGLAAAIVLPFCPGKNPLSFLLSLYSATLGSYDYAVLNTANLFYLAGGNWAGITGKAALVASLLPAISGAVGAILLWLRGEKFSAVLQAGKARFPRLFKQTSSTISSSSTQRNRAFAILFAALSLFSALCALLGASWSVLGYGLLAFAYLFVILRACFDGNAVHLPFDLALILILLYVFGPKIHERYLFCGLPLLLLSYILTQDRRLIWLFAGFSLTTYINTAVILNNSVVLGSAWGHLTDSTTLLNLLLCLCNLVLAGAACLLAIRGIQPCPLKAAKTQEVLAKGTKHSLLAKDFHAAFSHSPKLGLRPVDYLIMLAAAGLYALLCFSSLGSTVAPQTAYVSSSWEEEAVLSLEESQEFSLLYYGGVSYNDFAVYISEDGENWGEAIPCQMNEGLCYRWLYAVSSTLDDSGTVTYTSNKAENVLWFTGKYIRLAALSSGLNLWEIVARGRDGTNLSLSLVSHSGSGSESISAQYPAAHLCDEMETCVGEPSWYNGTYFDEIYYARTAYEMLHGQTVYETSHPPLGKLMMSASVAIFGMTPFGWRFPGALIGVLMLPAMYLLAWQLFHKRFAAVAAMGAMAFGLMHFTQTRLASIDSFPVFFIILSYFFMVRYLQTPFFTKEELLSPRAMDASFVRSLVPLLLCGISMGLSIASKWIGMYSAVGLAILFFAHLIKQIRIAKAAAAQENAPEEAKAAGDLVLGRAALTCAFCLLFFIAIPALIYYLCYIPYFVSSGGITLSKVINAQISMFNYHSSKGLGMDHPFYSPWWQWPLLMKPMWYAQDAYEPEGFASTILCFGNLWVFYLGGLAMIGLFIWIVIKLLKRSQENLLAENLKTPLILVISFVVQYVPWILVPRGTYIYHYFASLPFLILAAVFFITQLPGKRWQWLGTALYLSGALVFFGLYFPYASGLLTETATLDWIKQLYAGMKAIPGFSGYFNLWY